MKYEHPSLLEIKRLPYFSRIARLGSHAEIKVTLPEVAEILITSPRNARTLLKQMSESGWLEWVPAIGRNKKSSLYLNYSLAELTHHLAQAQMALGEYQTALELVDNDRSVFERLLVTTSGAQLREDAVHIQLTYDRRFSRLLPHVAHRNGERFLMRQIYSCLTKCDSNGFISPDLAHHWSYDEIALTWTFFLRPGIAFHDGQPIDAEQVAELFQALKPLPWYRDELGHIENINVKSKTCLVFQLSKPDRGLSGLLSGIKYSIQPAQQLTSEDTANGSGIFKIQEHSQHSLTLEAYENFHGYRALPESVTIWHTPEQNIPYLLEKLKKPKAQHKQVSEDTNQEKSAVRLEDGCMVAIYNARNNRLTDAQKSTLNRLIAKVREPMQEALALSTPPNRKPPSYAFNLLPSWTKVSRLIASMDAMPKTLSIAYFTHKGLEICAQNMAQVFESAGIRCTLNEMSHAQLYQLAQSGELTDDLILTSLNFDDNRPASLFSWMASDPLLMTSLNEKEQGWMIESLDNMRASLNYTDYLKELESIATSLISSFKLLPLFHHTQTIQFEDIFKGVRINAWGWPHLQDIWYFESKA